MNDDGMPPSTLWVCIGKVDGGGGWCRFESQRMIEEGKEREKEREKELME